MYQHRIARLGALTLFVATLSACGGGDESTATLPTAGSTPPPATAGTTPAPSPATSAAPSPAATPAPAVTYASPLLHTGNYRDVLLNAYYAMTHLNINLDLMARLVEMEPTDYACDNGRTLSIVHRDVDLNALPSPGDGYTATGNGCQVYMPYVGTLNGAVDGQLTQLSGAISMTKPYTATFTARLTDWGLTFVDDAWMTNLTPSQFVTQRLDEDNVTARLVGGSIKFAMRPQGTTLMDESRTLDVDVVQRVSFLNQGRYVPAISGQVKMTGGIYDNKQVRMVVSVEVALSESTGLINVKTPDGGRAQFRRFVNASGQLVDQTTLDANGDGLPEAVENGLPASFRL
jgi:hypothetical protein